MVGQSTDAILAYGYDLGEKYGLELAWLDDEDVDFDYAIEDRLLAKIVGFTEEWSTENEGYWKRRREALNQLGVELDYHCSCDDPMVFLAATGSITTASRGYPESIESLEIQPEWRENLNAALKVLEIEPKGELGWYLYSMWC